MDGKSVKGEGRGILQEDNFLVGCHGGVAVRRLGHLVGGRRQEKDFGSADKEVGRCLKQPLPALKLCLGLIMPRL